MMTKKLGALLIACASLVSVMSSGCQETTPARRKVTVVATGFLKGNLMPFSKEYSRKRTRVLGGYAHLAGRVNELARERRSDGGIVLVDLGNHMSGSLEAYASKGQMVVELMNKLPYAASLLSNLEFSYGQEVLRARARQAKFPYVSSNAKFEDAALSERVTPEVMQTVGGMKIAILGQTPDNLATICAPEVVKGVAIAKDLATLAVRAAELKRQGADFVVLLSKIPVDNPPAEVKKALSDSQIDLVLGIDYKNDGDAMTTWGRTMVTGLPGDNRGSRMKIVELSFDDSKKVVGHEASVEVISPDVNAPDGEVDRILTDFKSRVMVAFAEKVGTCNGPLTKGWREEATLGNLIADGMKAAAGTQLAVINSGAIQDDLAAGDVTVKDLFRVVPFDNNIVSLTVTGAQLKEALGAGLAQGTTFQVAGLSYRAKEEASGGVRLESLSVDGRDVDPAKSYTLAITDFALSRLEALKASGGEVRGTVRNVLTNALKTQSPVERKPEGRVTFRKLAAVKTAAGN